MLPLAAVALFGAMGVFHLQSRVRVAAPPPVPSTPPPVRAPPAPPARPPEPDDAPLPVYTGMLKMNGQPMALFEGRAGSFKVGDELAGGRILSITAAAVTVQQGARVRTLALDYDPKRYHGPPPVPPPPPREVRYVPNAPYVAPPLPTPPPLPPAQHWVSPPSFSPVTPPPLPTFAGSGSSRR